ncbi:hypothetical protein [Enterococcus sp. DIV0086]|uniref:hypothetical protein n=1 Tax=Enterococcus sp. DIV0086 TaxID=2774655 RepID=UPI003D2B4F4A
MTFGSLLSAGTNAYANSTNNIPGNNISANLKATFDPYIHVQNNRYVLEIPSIVNANSDEVEQVKKSIEYANSRIEINNETIDSNTKIATYQDFSLRAGESYTYSNF